MWRAANDTLYVNTYRRFALASDKIPYLSPIMIHTWNYSSNKHLKFAQNSKILYLQASVSTIETSNYWPVSLTSICRKVMEHIIYNIMTI